MRLKDGVIDLRRNSIVAVQPSRANGIPWFGKVLQLIGNDQVEVLWLHKSSNNAKLFFLNDTPNIISNDTIICNGVDMEPIYGYDKLLWKLLTPTAFIQALNADPDKMPTLAPPMSQLQAKQKKQNIDLTTLAFNNTEEFQKFLYNYET